jgi:amino acid adenylation domain-containing protein
MYDGNRFKSDAIARLAEHLRILLQQIVANSGHRIGELSLLSAAEREVLAGFNDTAVAYPQTQCLHDLFAAQAACTPEAVALIHEEETLSYGALERRANQIAHHLRTLGVGPDVVVALCVERSFDMVVGLIGILKAGGAYLPLDPSYPPERLAYMLADAKAPVLLTQAALVERLPESDATVVRLDADWPRIAAGPDTAPISDVAPANLAYVIYTSGSTGRPKGVMNAHSGIVNRIAWMQDAYRLTPSDRVLQKTPFGFDVSVWEFFWPLAFGAQLVIARPGGHQDPTYLAELIERAGVTITHFVPSMLQAFLETADLARCGSLRDTMCSGEALPVETQNRFLNGLRSRLHNLYGPTEAAVDVSAWACRLEEGASQVPIGQPISNIALHVLDHRLDPVPVGVTGELYIGGIGVARGYLGRAGLTAERFVPSPFATGERLYRTGDQVRWRSDGELEFLGRLDTQVKVRGFRIELGEVERVVEQLPAVIAATAFVRTAGGTLGVAAVLADGHDPVAGALLVREHCRTFLPEHMLPSTVDFVPALPHTDRGKVDRAALALAADAARAAGRAPATPREHEVCAVFAEVLDQPVADVAADFFELGGHSLLAARMVATLRKRTGLRASIPLLLGHPNPAALAAELDRLAEVSA